MADGVESKAAGAIGLPRAARPVIGDEELEPRPSALVRTITLPWRMLVAFYRDPRLLFGVVLLGMAVAAIIAPLIAPYDPLLYHPTHVAQPPSHTYLLGTDASGRDILSRVIYGTRVSLSVGLAAILVGGGIGTIFGLFAGYAGGWVDRLVVIGADALLAFPGLILALAIAAALGASVVNLVIALAVVRIPVYARLARAQTLQVRSLQYVEAARAVGTRTPRMLIQHVLPNIFSPLLVQATISISFAILEESTLSFLGLGAPTPTPEWGSMIAEAQPFLLGYDPWMIMGSGLALVVTVLSLNLFGDALRDKLDPHSADRGLRVRPGSA
jgi:peptide/nickel transport system permease protein